jgi:hypothetical protein
MRQSYQSVAPASLNAEPRVQVPIIVAHVCCPIAALMP